MAEDERSTEYSQYEHYQIGQNGQVDAEETETPVQKRRKKKTSFIRTIRNAVAAAVVFGLVAGGVFCGVLRLTGVFPYRENSTELERTELVGVDETSAQNNTGDVMVSQKGSVAEVAQASMPAVVAITTVSIQEIPTFFGYGIRRYQSEGSGSGIIVQ